MDPESFLNGEAKIEQNTPSEKKRCETDDEAIWESRFNGFFVD